MPLSHGAALPRRSAFDSAAASIPCWHWQGPPQQVHSLSITAALSTRHVTPLLSACFELGRARGSKIAGEVGHRREQQPLAAVRVPPAMERSGRARPLEPEAELSQMIVLRSHDAGNRHNLLAPRAEGLAQGSVRPVPSRAGRPLDRHVPGTADRLRRLDLGRRLSSRRRSSSSRRRSVACCRSA